MWWMIFAGIVALLVCAVIVLKLVWDSLEEEDYYQ